MEKETIIKLLEIRKEFVTKKEKEALDQYKLADWVHTNVFSMVEANRFVEKMYPQIFGERERELTIYTQVAMSEAIRLELTELTEMISLLFNDEKGGKE